IRMSEKKITASTPKTLYGWSDTSAARSGFLQSSRKETFARISRYSFMYRPAWRIIQTGVRSTGWRRHARSSLSFMRFQRPNDTIRRLMRTSESWTRTESVAVKDSAPPSISIVVPAFNEAGRIGESINKIDAFIRKSELSFEFIIVDDGS